MGDPEPKLPFYSLMAEERDDASRAHLHDSRPREDEAARDVCHLAEDWPSRSRHSARDFPLDRIVQAHEAQESGKSPGNSSSTSRRTEASRRGRSSSADTPAEAGIRATARSG